MLIDVVFIFASYTFKEQSPRWPSRRSEPTQTDLQGECSYSNMTKAYLGRQRLRICLFVHPNEPFVILVAIGNGLGWSQQRLGRLGWLKEGIWAGSDNVLMLITV